MSFARGARKGSRMTSTASERKTSSNAAVNLVSRSLSRNLLVPSSPSWSSQARFGACCVSDQAKPATIDQVKTGHLR